MEKVACKDCEYHSVVYMPYQRGNVCTYFIINKFDSVVGNYVMHRLCDVVNLHGECTHFIKKRPWWKKLFGISKPPYKVQEDNAG